METQRKDTGRKHRCWGPAGRRPALCGLVSSYRPGPLGFHRTCYPREAPGEAGVRPPSFLSTLSGRGKGRRAPPGFCEAGDLEGDTGQRAEHPGERATATPADPGQEDGRPAVGVGQPSPWPGSRGGSAAPARSPPSSPASCLSLALPAALAGTLRKQGLGHTDSLLEPSRSGHRAPLPIPPSPPSRPGLPDPSPGLVSSPEPPGSPRGWWPPSQSGLRSAPHQHLPQARPGNSWSCGRLESFPKKEFRLVNVSTVAADGKCPPCDLRFLSTGVGGRGRRS